MPLLRTTAAELAAYALSLAGLSRDRLPVPWTDSPSIDDCARFCSSAIWGGKPGPISWVDNFKTAGDGSYQPGSADLLPWDVLLFDWDGNGVGNHVEFMVADLGNGTVRTFGANGSDTRAAAYRLRPKHYILGRFRPRWSAQSAPIHNLLLNLPKELAMAAPDTLSIYVRQSGPGTFLAGPGIYQPFNPTFARKIGGKTQSMVEIEKAFTDSGVERKVLGDREYDLLNASYATLAGKRWA